MVKTVEKSGKALITANTGADPAGKTGQGAAIIDFPDYSHDFINTRRFGLAYR